MDRIREGRTLQSMRLPGLAAGFLSALCLLPPAAEAQIRPIQLEGLIITGTPVPRTVGTEAAHVTVLDGKELQARGVTRVADALAEVPGLVTVQNGSYGSVASVFFRGAESDHVKVLIDGIEVNQAGGSYDFSGLLTSDVERIEIARGPASALYGSDAVAGVVNILTRRGQGPPAATFSARAGSYGREEWSADLHGGTEGMSYSLAAARLASDGILEINNRFRSTSLSGSIHAAPDDRTRVSVSGRYGDRVYHYPTDGAGKVVDVNAFTFGEEILLGLEVGHVLSDRVDVRGVVRSYAWDGGSDDQPDGPEDNQGFFGFNSLDAFRRISADLRANLALLPRSVVSVGVEWEDESQRSFSETLSEYGPSTARSRYDRGNLGFYGHLTGEGWGWSGNGGARLEENDQYGSVFTYQVGLSRAISSTGTRIRGTLGRGFKEPTFFETSGSGYAVGNPDLEPERSMAWEVGLEQERGLGGGQVAITWFHQSLRDLIQYTFLPPVEGGPNFYNVAWARSRGAEVTARVPLGPILMSGGYTYLDTEVLDAGFDEGEGAVFVEGEPLIRRPEHQLTLAGVFSGSRGSLVGDVRVVGARIDRDFQAWPAVPVELARYVLVGLGGEVRILEVGAGRPGFDLQFRVENLLDEAYQEVFGFRAPGRAFLLGGRFRIGGGS